MVIENNNKQYESVTSIPQTECLINVGISLFIFVEGKIIPCPAYIIEGMSEDSLQLLIDSTELFIEK